MAWNEAVVTNSGIDLLIDAVQSGMIISSAVGGEEYDNPLGLMAKTGISGTNHSLNIVKIRKNAGGIRLIVRIENIGLQSAYTLRQIGLFAKSTDDGQPVLLAIIQDETGEVIPSYEDNPEFVSEFNFVLPISNVSNIEINMDPNIYATLGDLGEVDEKSNLHIADMDNPHGVTKDQVGLGSVDNTSDMQKPVSTAQQEMIDAAYQQSTGYTDQKIADLINGAPTTLDTLKEIADAMTEQAGVVEALDQAIGSKASEAEFESFKGIAQTKTGDTKDNTVTFDNDVDFFGGAPSWQQLDQITSGSTHKTLWERVKTIIKNAKYLYERMGDIDFQEAYSNYTLAGGLARETTTALTPFNIENMLAMHNAAIGGLGGAINTLNTDLIIRRTVSINCGDYDWAQRGTVYEYNQNLSNLTFDLPVDRGKYTPISVTIDFWTNANTIVIPHFDYSGEALTLFSNIQNPTNQIHLLFVFLLK